MALNLDDIKERLKNDFQRSLERLEENSTYATLRDRFQSQSPLVQKLIMSGVGFIVLLLLLSLPYSHLDSSSDSVTQFESKRALLRDLLHVQKEINESPEIPVPPPIDAVKSRVESELQMAQLQASQLKGVSIQALTKSNMIKAEQTDGIIEANVGQLTVRQMVEIGAQLQTISPSVKLKDLIVQASAGPVGYFDVVYRLLVLKVVPEELPPPEEVPKKKGKGP